MQVNTRISARFYSNVLVSFFCVAVPCFADAYVQRALNSTLDILIPSSLAKHSTPGVAVAVVENGRITLTRGYGFSDVSAKKPMTDRTLVNIASVSKLVSSWGVMRLAQDQKLNLDVPIVSLTRGWSFSQTSFDVNQVTARRLLSHTAGVSMPSVPWFPLSSSRPSLEQVLNGGLNPQPLRLVAPPGNSWAYSGGGYTLLQLAVEEITRSDIGAFMERAVFKPLGMKGATFNPSPESPQLAKLYDEKGKAIGPFRYVGELAGGLYASARDLGALLAEYQKAVSGHSRVIFRNTFAEMVTPVAKVTFKDNNGKPVDTGDAEDGLGHFVHRTRDGRVLLFHSGANPGALAYFIVEPTGGNGLFAVVNSENGGPVLVDILTAWAASRSVDLPVLF
jgi:CubicO group peptidase (beta-lactamase class C family)